MLSKQFYVFFYILHAHPLSPVNPYLMIYTVLRYYVIIECYRQRLTPLVYIAPTRRLTFVYYPLPPAPTNEQQREVPRLLLHEVVCYS